MTPEQIKELEQLALGFETSDHAESALAAALMPVREEWKALTKPTPEAMHRIVRVQLEAEGTARRSRRSAEAIRAALALITQ